MSSEYEEQSGEPKVIVLDGAGNEKGEGDGKPRQIGPNTPIIIKGGSITIFSLTELEGEEIENPDDPNGPRIWKYVYDPRDHKDIPTVDVKSHRGSWARRLTALREPEIIVHYP